MFQKEIHARNDIRVSNNSYDFACLKYVVTSN